MNHNDPAPPRPRRLERCFYAAYLGSGLLALAMTLLALGSGQLVLLVHATLSLVAALLFRARLVLDGQLAACAEEDDVPEERHGAGGAPDSATDHHHGHAAPEYPRDLARAET
jgi:hypothetical protein